MQTKIVKVKGGTIAIPTTPRFSEDVVAFIRLCKDEADECHARSLEVNGREVDCSASSVKLMREFDHVFGNGACKKVFGEGYVSFQAFVEFFDKLEPMMREWVKE